jgi:Protein of unknown function (DUF2934)
MSMNHVESHSPAETGAWHAYRSAFADFSQKVRAVQAMIADPTPDRAAIDTALLQVEKARVRYNQSRDKVARYLLASTASQPLPALEYDSPDEYEERVRTIAKLLWEVAGKPEGTAEDDWYRAENIIRRAAAA